MAVKVVRTEPYVLSDRSGESVFNAVMEYAALLKPGFVVDTNDMEEPTDDESDPHIHTLTLKYGKDAGVSFHSREEHDHESNETVRMTVEAATFGMPDGQSARVKYDARWEKGNRSYIELEVDAHTIAQSTIIARFKKTFAAPSDEYIEQQKEAMQEALGEQQWGATQDRAMELLMWRPDDPDVLLALGTSMIISKQTDQAEKVMERLLEIKPDSYQAHLNLGSVWMDRKDYDKAIEHYQAMVDLQPDQDFAPFILATAYEAKGDTREALKLYRRVLKMEQSEGPTNFHELAMEAIRKLNNPRK
jgi:DNA-binding SARP family transcriptional activator